MAPRITLAALLACAGLLIGCGGTGLDLTSDRGLSAPAGGDFDVVAGSICRRVGQRFSEAQDQAPKTFAQGEEVTAALIDVAGEGERQLAALDPPAADERAYERYLRSRGAVVTLLEDANEAAAAGDGEGYEQARRGIIGGASQRARLAAAAGLPRCAQLERG